MMVDGSRFPSCQFAILDQSLVISNVDNATLAQVAEPKMDWFNKALIKFCYSRLLSNQWGNENLFAFRITRY
jgi:hypothetical protein